MRDGAHRPFIPENSKHLRERMHSTMIDTMCAGIYSTNSIGSDDAEYTIIITLVCIPSEYALYKQGATDRNGITLKKNIDAAKSAYNNDKQASMIKYVKALRSPRKNTNMTEPFFSAYAVLSDILTPIAIPITRKSRHKSEYINTATRLRLSLCDSIKNQS